jgi:cell division protein FtsB
VRFEISEQRALPEDAVTSTIIVLGKKGKGKTFFVGVLEEEFAKHKVPFTVIDPMSAHWGIKEKYQVVIFGGPHADVPLDPSLGSEIADLTIETGMSNILDIRDFSETAQRRFVADFTRRLMERNRSPRHVFYEEADKFCPQMISGDTAQVYHEVDSLIRRGRQFGLGVSVISQRAARLNKDATSQGDAFFFFGMPGTQDRKAVEDMIEGVAEPAEVKKIYGKLPTLPPGTCIVYSPEWLKITEEINIRARETFHAGRTPKLGELENFQAVPVEAAELKARMEALIGQKAEEEDELAQLRRTTAKKDEEIEKLNKRLEIRGELKDLLDERQVKVTVKEGVSTVEPIPNMADIEKKYGDQLAASSREKELLSQRIKELENESNSLAPYRRLKAAMDDVWHEQLKTIETPPPGLEPSIDYAVWLGKLEPGAKRILEYMAARRGMKLGRPEIARALGWTKSGSSFSTGMATLRRNGLLKQEGMLYWAE